MERINISNFVFSDGEERKITDFMLEAAPTMVFQYTTTDGKSVEREVGNLSHDTLVRYEHSYSLYPAFVIIVLNGKIYVGPNLFNQWNDELFNEEHLRQESMYIEMSDYKPANRIWFGQYDKLLCRWQLYFNSMIRDKISEGFEERGIKFNARDREFILSHSLKIPNCGINLTRTQAADGYIGYRSNGSSLVKVGGSDNLKYYPKKPSLEWKGYFYARDIGYYEFKAGVAVFLFEDGNTYITPDYSVVECLERAGYELRNPGNSYVPFVNGEKILSPEIERKWNELVLVYAPEMTFDWENRDWDVYPQIKKKNS